MKYTSTVMASIPPPNGTAIPGHEIQLQYQVGTIGAFGSFRAGKKLNLFARKEDLNYMVRVEVRVTDAIGRKFSDAANLPMKGDIAEFGEDYYEYLNQCIKTTAGTVNKKGRFRPKVKPGDPQQQLASLLDEVSQQVREGDPDATALIPTLTKIFGAVVVSKAMAGKLF